MKIMNMPNDEQRDLQGKLLYVSLEDDARNHYYSIPRNRTKRRIFWAWVLLPTGYNLMMEISATTGRGDVGTLVFAAVFAIWIAICVGVGRKYSKFDGCTWIMRKGKAKEE